MVWIKYDSELKKVMNQINKKHHSIKSDFNLLLRNVVKWSDTL